MNRETEKIFLQMHKYMEQFDFENEEQMQEEMKKFIQKLNDGENEFEDDPRFESDDLLEEAYNTSSKTKAIKLARQALEIYPDNIDAECFIAEFEENQIKKLAKMETIIEKSKKILEQDNMFDEDNMGHFWGIVETRPYMRARNRKITILMDLGRYTEAIKECEEMLKLCESDNLGIRYTLIGLYCILEKFEDSEKLYKKFNEYSAFMIFPMAIMYFKKGDYKKSKKFLKDTQEVNPYIIKILKNDIAMLKDSEDIEYYEHGSIEEASIIVNDLLYLLMSVPSFITFMEITKIEACT